MATKIFISYRRDDTRYQARLTHALLCKAVPSDHVFMDVDSIPPGANFRKILKDWVDQCEVLLALIGPGWIDARDRTKGRLLDNKSVFVRIEIGEALGRNIPVVPVLIDDAPMPDVDLLPDDLKELVNRQAEFVGYRTFYADVERLIRKLRLNQDVGPSNNFATVPQNKPRNEKAKAPESKASKPGAIRREMRDEWTITRGPNWGTDANVPPRTGNQGRKMLAAIECGTVGKFKAHKLFYAGGSNGLINMWFNYDKGFILLNNGKAPRRPITGKGRVHDDRLGDTSDLPTREGRWARRRIWQHA